MGILAVLEYIQKNPFVLKTCSEKEAFLQTQGNKSAQGTGNKVTSQEACFAELLEKHEFVFLSKKDTPIQTNYYKYQPNGTQKSPDFEVYDQELKCLLKFDLKHTSSKTFYFNDGWFEKGVIYVISWSPKKDIHKVLIGLGDDIPTEEENIEMAKFVQFKKDCNKQNKKVGSLRKCIRFANQYSCECFTEEFSFEKFNRLVETVTVQSEQSSEYKSQELRSQSV